MEEADIFKVHRQEIHMNYYERQIGRAFKHAKIISCESYPKMVFFSDCHRGNGTWNDSFLHNKTLYQAAIDHYWKEGFAYVEIGDGDELWENRCFGQIYEIHSDVFKQLERFQNEGRIFMIFGNHDRAKSKRSAYPAQDRFAPTYYEALVIKIPKGNKDLCLIHGHQADFFNDRLWPLARWMVRYLWKPLELAAFKDPTSAARNYKKGKAVEKRLISWAKNNRKNIMAGHTHRPAMLAKDGVEYLNTGSAVHPNGITCIELVYGKLNLVRWTTCVDENSRLYVCRQEMEETYLF